MSAEELAEIQERCFAWDLDTAAHDREALLVEVRRLREEAAEHASIAFRLGNIVSGLVTLKEGDGSAAHEKASAIVWEQAVLALEEFKVRYYPTAEERMAG